MEQIQPIWCGLFFGGIIWCISSAAALFFEDLSATDADEFVFKTRVDADAFDEAASVVTTTMSKSWTTGDPTADFTLPSLVSEYVDSESEDDMVRALR